jgi:hypothetical protein
MAGSDGRRSYLGRFGGFVQKISGPCGKGLLREKIVLCAGRERLSEVGERLSERKR